MPRLIIKDLKVKKPMIYYSKERILKTFISKGYRAIIIKKKHYTLHRLIAEAFIPKIEGENIINHIDGNKLNNSIDNLEWCTYSENNKHAYDTGLNLKGEKHGRSKFTSKTIKEIRQIYIKGNHIYGARGLARRFNMSKTNILDIVNNKIWKDVV